MTESLVKLDNLLAWDGKEKPFLESYNLFVQDPKSHWLLWLSYGLVISHDGLSQQGFVWSYFKDSVTAEPIIIENHFDLNQHEIAHTDQFITLGDSMLSLAESNGSTHNPDHNIKWNLRFEDPVISEQIYRHQFLYSGSVPKTKFLFPRLKTFARGAVFVNSEKHEFQNAHVYQDHRFGPPKGGFEWIHCNRFEEDSSAHFTALCQKNQLGQLPLPALKTATLSCGDQNFTVPTWAHMLWACRWEQLPNSCQISWTNQGHFIQCHIDLPNLKTSDPKSLNHLINPKTCLDAGVEIQIFRKHRGSLQPHQKLTCQGQALYQKA